MQKTHNYASEKLENECQKHYSLNKNVISKCVPLEISRKRFSDFVEYHEGDESLYLVGYVINQDGKKENRKVSFSDVKPLGMDTIPPIDRTPLENEFDENNGIIIDFAKKPGYIDFTPDGTKDDYFFLFNNTKIGVVTHVIINNNKLDLHPITINYGRKEDDNYVEITKVEPSTRCVITILHSKKSDIVLDVTHSNDNNFVDKEDTDNTEDFTVDLEQGEQLVEFIPVPGKNEYYFMFNNYDIGTVTYFLIDNTQEYAENVLINYGREEEYLYLTEVPAGSKCVIEILHGNNTDIVINKTFV